jgi:hypothetical protein
MWSHGVRVGGGVHRLSSIEWGCEPGQQLA